MRITPRLKDSFFIKGNSTGCLLIHGFSGSPGEIRPLGEYLAEQGFTVLGVKLAGHATKEEDLEKTSWEDWYKSAWEGYNTLKSNCDKVCIIGFSMGGLLALKLSAENKAAGVVSISAPIYLRDWKINFLPIIMLFKKYSFKKQKSYLDEKMHKYLSSYKKMPLKAVRSLLELIEITKEQLTRVKCPALIIQSQKDGTVNPRSARYIHNNIGSLHKELVWFYNSGHLIVLDKDREDVFSKINVFLKKITNETGGKF